MATLRQWLIEAGYSPDTGYIVYHETKDEVFNAHGLQDQSENVIDRSLIGWNHPILDKEFDDGYGCPEAPRIVVEDAEAIYFPTAYDGSTELVKVRKGLRYYLSEESVTPYPGS